MINRIFIVTNNIEAVNAMSGNDNVFFCMPLKSDDKDSSEKTYQLYSERNAAISLLIEIQEQLTGEQINRILSFLFLPSYAKLSGKFVIAIFSKTNNLVEESIKSLNEAVKEQGFENVEINRVSSEKVLTSKADFIAFYQSLLQSELFFGNNLYFESNEITEIEILIAAVKEMELAFKEKNPAFYLIAMENLKLKEEKDLLKQENKAIANELSNQKEYADILRNSHSARQLQEYYNGEYEVLPTWFKRLGHIVKVATGKRKMKSLFNDKQKKQ